MADCVYLEDDLYPNLLAEIDSAPEKLFYKGVWREQLFDKCLAVVGSRRMTSYGKMAVENLAFQLASAGITIVSGFMYGVDAAAHRAALAARGNTIAVMPCGIDTINPPDQEDLYREIIDSGGLIISEYEGDSKPQLWTYPKRNRIVAGLCKAVLIIEAGMNSGSLITADYAKKFGRQIFAVPGSIFSSNSEGTNFLIREGAISVSSADQILDHFNIFPSYPIFNEGSSGEADEVLDLLSRETLNLDDLSEKIDISVSELSSKVTLLLLSGRIFEEGGRYYVNKG